MKIFVIPTSYPNKYNPVANIFVAEQVKALAKLGHEIVVLNVVKRSTKDFFKKNQKKIEKIQEEYCIRYTLEFKTFMEAKFVKYNCNGFSKNMIQLYEFVCNDFGNPDILYAHFSLYAGYAATKIKEKYHIPLVTLEHDSMIMKMSLRNKVKSYLRHTIQNSDKFIVVSNGLKNAIEKTIETDKTIYILSNIVDDLFSFHERVQKENFIFFSCGNLNKRKRFDLLINAFLVAFLKEDNVQLIIGGEGKERKVLEKLIYKNKREDQIKLLGRISRSETLNEYIKCDCFVLPSECETFGLVYREAMAVGRQIITTDHGGFESSIWDENNGIIIDVDDKVALVSALKYIKNNIFRYDLKRIAYSCLEKCSSIKIAKQIIQIFQEVLSEG